MRNSAQPSRPPRLDELEVSVFGPGKGESVLVHLGAHDWIVVDSCVDQLDKTNPALHYLERIGVDVADSVRLVVGTHAHDDHIAGLGDIYTAAKGAHFVCSSALSCEEFFAQVEADAEIERIMRQSIRREYRQILDEVESRDTPNPPLKYAIESLVLWSRPASDSVPRAEIRALSPSHIAVSRAKKNLAIGAATVGTRRRLAASDPNEMAVALWIEVGEQAVLLGADLLRGPHGCGWEAVLASHQPTTGKASVFKVPHHGAPNAHHDGVWGELLASEAVALLAPYRGGVTPRPAQEDIERIGSFTPRAFITASPRIPSARRAVRRTAASLQCIAANVRDPWGTSGHVRARAEFTADEWRVECFWPAQRLQA